MYKYNNILRELDSLMEDLTFLPADSDDGDEKKNDTLNSDIDNKFKEWKKLKVNLEVINALAERIADRIKDLEEPLFDFIKSISSQTYLIDKSLIKFKETQRKNVSYLELFNKALSIATEDQRNFLQNIKDSLTHTSIIKSMKLIDPDLEKVILEIKSKKIDELVGVLDKINKIEIEKEESKTNEGMFDSAISWIKSKFKAIKDLLLKSQKSAEYLLKVAIWGDRSLIKS